MSGHHPSHRPGSSPVFGSFHREEYEGNWTPEDDDTPELCPMGCGRTTDDMAGGPCSKCWDEAPASGRTP